MTFLIIFGVLALFLIIATQIGKIADLSARIRGEEKAQLESNTFHANFGMFFLGLFMIGCIFCTYIYRNDMLGYGPHVSASAHGKLLDDLFHVTLVVTGIVFVLTHIALFWFAYKYKGVKGGKVEFISHNNRLEYIWTGIPAVVMFFLVAQGLTVWNEVMGDYDPEEDYIEIEATGYQFAWELRYPGPDGKLGGKDYKLITGINSLGQDFTDEKGFDDFKSNELVLPKGRKIRVRITARDVLHNFYLPHFRVKMDAVPGIPTHFIFTPEMTTEEYREQLVGLPRYERLFDASDPSLGTMAENFEYELACAELCGSGHFSMRKIVKVVEEDDYEAWLDKQQSFYKTVIRGLEGEDPNYGKQLDFEMSVLPQTTTDNEGG